MRSVPLPAAGQSPAVWIFHITLACIPILVDALAPAGPHPRVVMPTAHVHRSEAAVVLGIHEDYAAGVPLTRIVANLNRDGVPHPNPRASGRGPSTVHAILRNLKYTGVWKWNQTGKRRDPRTGRRRSFRKPESEHMVITDETLLARRPSFPQPAGGPRGGVGRWFRIFQVVEAAGVEPASEGPAPRESTCVSTLECVAPGVEGWRKPPEAEPRCVSSSRVGAARDGQPAV